MRMTALQATRQPPLGFVVSHPCRPHAADGMDGALIICGGTRLTCSGSRAARRYSCTCIPSKGCGPRILHGDEVD